MRTNDRDLKDMKDLNNFNMLRVKTDLRFILGLLMCSYTYVRMMRVDNYVLSSA